MLNAPAIRNSWHPVDVFDALAPRRAARVRNGRVLCDDCNGVADTVHLLPSVARVTEVRAACPGHDPRGYTLRLEKLSDPEGFASLMFHLASKGNGAALVELLRYLAPARKRLPNVEPVNPLSAVINRLRNH